MPALPIFASVILDAFHDEEGFWNPVLVLSRLHANKSNHVRLQNDGATHLPLSGANCTCDWRPSCDLEWRVVNVETTEVDLLKCEVIPLSG